MDRISHMAWLLGKNADAVDNCINLTITVASERYPTLSESEVIDIIGAKIREHALHRGKYIADILTGWRFLRGSIKTRAYSKSYQFEFITSDDGVIFNAAHTTLTFPDDIRMTFNENDNTISFSVPYTEKEEGFTHRYVRPHEIFSIANLMTLFNDEDTQYSKALLSKRLKKSSGLFNRWYGKKGVDIVRDMYSFMQLFITDGSGEEFGDIAKTHLTEINRYKSENPN